MNAMIYGGAFGMAAGFAFNRIAVYQVKRRVGESDALDKVNKVGVTVVSVMISGILFALIFKLYGSIAQRLEYAAYVSTAISIGVVDLGIKKIPNSSVLALLAVRTASIIYELATGVSVKEALLPSLIGLVAAFILYQIPRFFGIPIGTGDVKFASAIGYCLGVFGFLQSAIIMAAGLLILLVWLTATKKGSLKTKVPMGPFLSLGAVATVLVPVFTGLTQQIFPK